MGQLKSNRTSDSTYIGQTDDWDRELEEDIADIIGVDLDTNISSPIFADGVANSANAVQSSGKIDGVLRFLSSSGSSAAAAGVEFEHGADRYKIACVSPDLNLYKWNAVTEVWDLVGVMQGSGTFLGLSDVDPSTYVDQAGKSVVVNATEDGLEFAAGAAVSGNLEDLDDVPAYPAADRYLMYDNTIGEPQWVAASGGAATKFSALTDTFPDSDMDNATQEGYNIQGIRKTGVGDYELHWGVPVHGVFDGNESSYSTEDPNIPTILYFDEKTSWEFEAGGSWFTHAGDGTEIYIPKWLPGIYTCYFSATCTNAGAYGGKITVTGSSPLLAAHWESVAQDVIYNGTDILVANRRINFHFPFVMRPSGVSTGSSLLRFQLEANAAGATVSISTILVSIQKVG
jgi:hypothetical protein